MSAAEPPVFTVAGRYTARGWTEWTQGFQYGSAILQYDATSDAEVPGNRPPQYGRKNGRAREPCRRTRPWFQQRQHLRQFIAAHGRGEGIADDPWERRYYELALKLSGAIQARRWTPLPDGGFIYSFNGPHSLFVDTMRSLRSLGLAHQLGHSLMEENDRRVDLLHRIKCHATATARYAVYYGRGRDVYDLRGRVAHESIFNVNDGAYRSPNSQQGYSPFSTWTRGLAWAMCGFAEQLEYMAAIGDREIEPALLEAACATCDFYIDSATASDGIPYWDTGAPGLPLLGDWMSRPAEPDNAFEPVDSSAAAIAVQGLLRLGRYTGETRYFEAGLTVLCPPVGRALPQHRSRTPRLIAA